MKRKRFQKFSKSYCPTSVGKAMVNLKLFENLKIGDMCRVGVGSFVSWDSRFSSSIIGIFLGFKDLEFYQDDFTDSNCVKMRMVFIENIKNADYPSEVELWFFFPELVKSYGLEAKRVQTVEVLG